jgi:hypothetical protein
VSTTTRTDDLPRGIEYRPGRPKPYRVRKVKPYQSFATADEAKRFAIDIDIARAQGKPLSQVPDKRVTLAQAATAYGTRRKARKTKKGHKLAQKTVDWIDDSLHPWIAGPLAGTAIVDLSFREVDEYLTDRQLEHARSAANERQFLLGTLEHARDHMNAQVDPKLFTLEPIHVEVREREALTRAELEFLVSYAPDYGRRLLHFLGTTGMRINEAFLLEDGWLSDDHRVVHVPDWACKERRDKDVVLYREEPQLVRDQILARAQHARRLFPKKEGTAWRYQHFDKLVWSKAKRRAAAAWQEQQGTDGPTPFDDLTLHDLRSTAISLMREDGVAPEIVAVRVGHDDGGALALRKYRKMRTAEQRATLEAIDEANGAAAGATTLPPLPTPDTANQRAGVVVPFPQKAAR